MSKGNPNVLADLAVDHDAPLDLDRWWPAEVIEAILDKEPQERTRDEVEVLARHLARSCMEEKELTPAIPHECRVIVSKEKALALTRDAARSFPRFPRGTGDLDVELRPRLDDDELFDEMLEAGREQRDYMEKLERQSWTNLSIEERRELAVYWVASGVAQGIIDRDEPTSLAELDNRVDFQLAVSQAAAGILSKAQAFEAGRRIKLPRYVDSKLN